MRARFPIHQVSTRDARAQWQARRDAFRDAYDVGLRIVMIGSEHLAGAAHAALNFVDDEQDPIFITDATQATQESLRRRGGSSFGLHWFDHDGGDVFGRRRGFEQRILDPIQTSWGRAAVSAGFTTERIAIISWIRNVN